ncbi:MAG: UDP-3-O-acylglucosamine N-acyltransferase [Candidatus Izimaplasma bacterium HR2]|nr:MAG: UDP-3-O-acylglucosamine N-acyltransferase [Candidatus Izimaplasma bacterium HR2]
MISIGKILDYLDKNDISYSFKGDKKVIINKPYVNKGDSSCFYYSLNREMFREKVDLLISRFEINSPIKNLIITKDSKYVFYFILSNLFSVKSFVINNRTILSVKLGENTVISSNVKFNSNIKIGNSNSIGGEAFSYYEIASVKHKVIPYASLVIQDNVEVANSCIIDRGILSDTVIGTNTKIDSLVYIAHDVKIGKNCIITSGVRINGYSNISNNCYLGSGSIIRNNINIGKNTTVGMGAVVTKSFGDNLVLFGNPAIIKAYKCQCSNILKFNTEISSCECGVQYKLLSNKVVVESKKQIQIKNL